jgi:hypothetical protein
MPIIIQEERKRDIQKQNLRTLSRVDDPRPVSSGLYRKMVNFSLVFLPALNSTRTEKKNIRNGTRKSKSTIITFIIFRTPYVTAVPALPVKARRFQSRYIAG